MVLSDGGVNAANHEPSFANCRLWLDYGMSWPDYPKWVECVRAKTLGETRQEVVTFLKAEPDFKEGVSSAVAQTLGKRCKKS